LDPPSPGYISNVFLVQKKTGGMRPILNLKRLNKGLLDTPHFRMDTVEDVPQTICPGIGRPPSTSKMPTSIYPSTPWPGSTCISDEKALFTNLWLSPSVGLQRRRSLFTSLTKRLKAKLGCLGIRTIFFLEDILILGTNFTICTALSMLMNWEKSSLSPTTHFKFLGMNWDLKQETHSLPEEKLLSLQRQVEVLLQSLAPTCHQVMVLTGLIAAFHKAVPLLHLKGRWMQMSLNLVYSSELYLQKTVILLPQATRDLDWICNLQLHQCQGHLWPLTPKSCAQ
jgi:hypothetical protein